MTNKPHLTAIPDSSALFGFPIHSMRDSAPLGARDLRLGSTLAISVGASMKSSLRALLIAAAVLVSTPAAFAYQTVLVGEVEATRVVIAPPQTPLAGIIRDGLRATLEGAGDARATADARQLYYFYGERHFEPVWLTEQSDGTPVLSPAARDVVAVFRSAHLQGLDPDDYLTPDLDLSLQGAGPDALARLETAFSAAALRYAQDAYSGRLDPRTVSGFIDIAPKRVDEAELLETLLSASDPAAVLMSYHPTHPEFLALRDLLAEHYAGTVEALVTIPAGSTLRPGETDARVPQLRERLSVAAPASPASAQVYDPALVAAVEAFQSDLGLTVDGIIGPATVAALNGANGASIETITANMERWRWLPEDLGDFHVFVNIPEYRLEVNNSGRTTFETRIIVGSAQNQTPLFSDQIRHVVTNPYWNVPASILRNEVIPATQRNPGYLASQNMELIYRGSVINASALDISVFNPGEIRVRQRPGASNALGMVKFLFPNSHDVYLHDTNNRGLFARSSRALSHGCIRVEDPFAFAEALLAFESRFNVASLETTLGGNEQWFNMNQHVPVHLAYFTLRIGGDGQVRSYADVYGHDAAVIAALGL